MTSNSRPVTSHSAFGSATSSPSNRVSASYSDSLMDDLFGDVDRILDGDLSACMTVVKPQRQTADAGTRTVQLPSNFSPRSAADIYHATMAASSAQRSPQQANSSIYHQPTSGHSVSNHRPSSSRAARYSRGGRPMTGFSTGVGSGLGSAAAESGNFRSAVMPPATGSNATTIDVQPSTQTAASSLYPPVPLSELNLTHASPRPPQTIFEPTNLKSGSSQQSVSLPFLLMGAAGISVASTLGLWALGSSGPGGLQLAFNTEASAAELPNSREDFLVYLQKSLDTISATHPPTGQTVAVIPAAAPAPTVPSTVPNLNTATAPGVLPNLPGAAPAAAPNVIERVFVPVYEGQQNTQVAVAPATALPNAAVPSAAQQRPTVPVPAPVAAAAALPPGAPAAPTASVPIVPAGADLPTPAVTATAPTNAAVTGLSDVTPASEQVLVGVLNLGSRSAALFDVDGSSQRAYVGDRIGTSAWTLVSVNGQDVVIRRDGEVRSVYIGQRF